EQPRQRRGNANSPDGGSAHPCPCALPAAVPQAAEGRRRVSPARFRRPPSVRVRVLREPPRKPPGAAAPSARAEAGPASAGGGRLELTPRPRGLEPPWVRRP